MQKLDPDHMPEFGPNRGPGEADSAWRALRALEGAGFLSIDPIRSKIGRADYELSPRVRLVVDREDELRTLSGIARRGPGPQRLWREALVRCFGAGHPGVETLSGFRMPFIEGRSLDDIALKLQEICTAQPAPAIALRTVSARYFWGDSKFLDDRGDLLAALYGTRLCPHPEMRVQLGIQIGSDDFDNVIIVENQDTFDLVCQVTRSLSPAPVVLCAHGFKASAARIRLRAGCLPLYAVQAGYTDAGRERFERWLFRESNETIPVWFWGDLDWEAMRILKSLRDAFPGARCWEPGYAPMVSLLRAADGHLPGQAGKDRQRKIETTGCAYADEQLLTAIAHTGRFIDQEVVLADELRMSIGSER